ncbi:peptidoglycan-binding domain-containing protein [Vibrio parahaemolyticus]|uniref:peptidoglycan-binding domain-containing protein n=1 Tax=Vibrio parahaemolyticus TaxID=670 RepID=UPI002556C657|nr:peptidoglycan-binding domain-containing protein [Vibrio parahaemolyticus]
MLHLCNFSQVGFTNRVNAALFNGKWMASQRNGVVRYVSVYAFLKAQGMRIPLSYLAYTLATVYHETARYMQPIEEFGKGDGYPYGVPDEVTGQTYYGRGDVQTTWKRNYETLAPLLFKVNMSGRGVDIVTEPSKLLIPFYSAQATIIGMNTGLFTGKQYSDYLDLETPDYVGARRIINGTDQAHTIAGYAHEFEQALRVGFGAKIDRDLIKIGSSGGDVRELQLNLNLNPDGKFGSNTEMAVKQFQLSMGLDADGTVGKATWKALEDECYWGDAI